MLIKKDVWMTAKRNGEIWSNLPGEWKRETDQDKINICKKILSIAKKSKSISQSIKDGLIDKYISDYQILTQKNIQINTDKDDVSNLAVNVCNMLINFFKDFNFEPNFRFINTLSHHTESLDECKEYIFNYFNLVDNQFKNDIVEKMKSKEFKDILFYNLQRLHTQKIINHRFKLYYGSQGTGKTTQALKETNNVVMVCHSAMLPSDLLEDFKFNDGKPEFKHSVLWDAMENGTKITLDEINLLPFESLRFLQSILDNKTEINYKGQVIHVKDGFQIIGTMNLVVNGSVFSLPEPLIDRAADLKMYKFTAEQLKDALI